MAAVVREYKARPIPLSSSVHCRVYQQGVADSHYAAYEIALSYPVARNRVPAVVAASNKTVQPQVRSYRAAPDLSQSSVLFFQHGPHGFLDSAILLLFKTGTKTQLCFDESF